MKDFRVHITLNDGRVLQDAAAMVQDPHLREYIPKSVAFHHAGLSPGDRQIVEELFLSGRIKVLVSTSTLAMGVNLPAHLVIIKSTTQMVNGIVKEYSDSQVKIVP